MKRNDKEAETDDRSGVCDSRRRTGIDIENKGQGMMQDLIELVLDLYFWIDG